MTQLLAAFPAPPFRNLPIGPLSLRMYGLMIALGVLAAVWLAQKRWQARGHDPADISAMAMWAVPAGIVGARAYHVITDYQLFEGRWHEAFYIWEGGLGIPGGIAAGVVAGLVYARVKKLPIPELFDTVAPALPLAQAIGRWGNWFNQELFGRPSDLPWALEVDPANRPQGYAQFDTFQPTFLYESLWNLALVAALIWVVEPHLKLRPGRLFAFYVGGYGLGRLWVESLRIDEANKPFLGWRVNTWMSLLLIVGAAAFLLRDRLRPAPAAEAGAEDEGEAAAEADAEAADVAAGSNDADEEPGGTDVAVTVADDRDEEPGDADAEAVEAAEAEADEAGDEDEDEEPEPAVTSAKQGEDAEHGDKG